MANLLVRDVPEDIHRELTARAQRAGKSLQQFLRAELERLALEESLEDVLDRIGQRRGGTVSIEDAVDSVREDRDRR